MWPIAPVISRGGDSPWVWRSTWAVGPASSPGSWLHTSRNWLDWTSVRVSWRRPGLGWGAPMLRIGKTNGVSGWGASHGHSLCCFSRESYELCPEYWLYFVLSCTVLNSRFGRMYIILNLEKIALYTKIKHFIKCIVFFLHLTFILFCGARPGFQLHYGY